MREGEEPKPEEGDVMNPEERIAYLHSRIEQWKREGVGDHDIGWSFRIWNDNLRDWGDEYEADEEYAIGMYKDAIEHGQKAEIHVSKNL